MSRDQFLYASLWSDGVKNIYNNFNSGAMEEKKRPLQSTYTIILTTKSIQLPEFKISEVLKYV